MSFLPVKNARMTLVARGRHSTSRDPYSTVAAPAAQQVWSGRADALVTTRRVVSNSGDSTDLLLITMLTLPAVCELRAGDQVTITTRRNTAVYRLKDVADDPGDFHPVGIYQCVAEAQ